MKGFGWGEQVGFGVRGWVVGERVGLVNGLGWGEG